MDIIEGYLLETTRAELRKDWEESFACWENRCYAYDHFSTEKQIAAFRQCFHDPDNPNRYADMTELNDGCLEALEEDLMECKDPENSEWRRLHEGVKEDWIDKTGEPTGSSRGLFSKYANLMKTRFGLEVAVIHTSELGEISGQWFDDDDYTPSYQTTLAYLTLPGCTKIKHEWARRGENSRPRGGPPYHHPESGGAWPVAIPDPPSAKSLARFPRALKILDLRPKKEDEEKEDRPTIFASGGDKSAVALSVKRSETSGELRPQLTLLMWVNDEPSWP